MHQQARRLRRPPPSERKDRCSGFLLSHDSEWPRVRTDHAAIWFNVTPIVATSATQISSHPPSPEEDLMSCSLATSTRRQPDIRMYITAPTLRSGCSFFFALAASPSLLDLTNPASLGDTQLDPHTATSSPGVCPGKHAFHSFNALKLIAPRFRYNRRLRAVFKLISL